MINPRARRHQLVNLNAWWPGFSSTSARGAASWPTRVAMLAAAVLHSGTGLVTAQELGKAEAADLARTLGPRWRYQRAGLNAVLWDGGRWQLGAELDRPVRALELSAFGQLQRTVLAVKLLAEGGGHVWAASTHLAAAASDLTELGAVTARATQTRELTRWLAPYRWLILGADLNSRPGDDAHQAPRWQLARAGWALDTALPIAGLASDRKRGLDVVATRPGVELAQVRILPLGRGSDHDARHVLFTLRERNA